MTPEERVEARFHAAASALMLPLREAKVVDEPAFAEMMATIDEMDVVYQSERLMPRKLAGWLLVVFVFMLAQADYAVDAGPIRQAAWRYEERIVTFFGTFDEDEAVRLYGPTRL